jgi:hypothetical protein
VVQCGGGVYRGVLQSVVWDVVQCTMDLHSAMYSGVVTAYIAMCD